MSYPSLASPLTGVIYSKSFLSPQPDVFERLQEDTEKRMRARLECFTSGKPMSLRAQTPVSLTIHSFRDKRSFSRNEPIRRQSSYNDFSFKPEINEHSKFILKSKYLQKSKIQPRRKIMYEDEEYSNPADLEEIQVHPTPEVKMQILRRNEAKAEKPPAPSQQQIYSQDKEKKERKETPNNTIRKYTPMFTKPFDISKILKKPKLLSKTKASANISSSKNLRPEIRPLLRPISESNIRIEDALHYKQVVQGRLAQNIPKTHK